MKNSAVYLAVYLWLHAGLCTAAWFKETQHIMGTEVSVELWATNQRLAEENIRGLMREMRRIDSAMNPWDSGSELAAINRGASKSPMPLSTELFKLIKKSLYYSRISDGAFDISFASVAQFYDYRLQRKPSEDELREFRTAINFRKIKLDEKARTIYFGDKKLIIDLGGIAKGYAVDRGIEMLRAAGVSFAIVSAGGDSRVLGDKRGKPWVIGIRHPRLSSDHIVRIPLQDTAISTSGDYERFFIEDGQRYHHIIDPTSAQSARAVQSVSILSAFAVDSDALSTTVFVLGVKRGLALVNSLPGVDAIIIDDGGLLHYSDELLMPLKNK